MTTATASPVATATQSGHPKWNDRVDFFQVRDYIFDVVADYFNVNYEAVYTNKKDDACISVLYYLAMNALYARCSDERYGEVVQEKCSQKVIVCQVRRSPATVVKALRTLEEDGLIERRRGGRRAGRPDHISIRPLMDMVKERLDSEERTSIKDPSNRIPTSGAFEIVPGLVFHVGDWKFQVGKEKIEAGYDGPPAHNWEVFCRVKLDGWMPATSKSRQGQWFTRWEEEELRDRASSWWLAEEW